MRHAARFSVALAAILAVTGTAGAQTNYTFTALDPQDSSASSVATDINDHNVAVGTRTGGAYKWTAAGGEQPLISDPVANSKFPATGAFQINNAGTVMGTACQTVCFTPPFVPATWSPTAGLVFLPLNEPPFGVATAINNAGTVVGSGRFTTAIWRPNQPQQAIVGLFGAAIDVNDLEQVLGGCVGDVCGPAGTPAVWTQAGGRVLIPRLPGHLPEVPYTAIAINNRGMVVGSYTTAAGGGMFFWSAATGTVDLNAPGKPEEGDINDRGEIVATVSHVPYLFKNGIWKNLNTLVPAGTHMLLKRVTAINNNGWMTGSGTNFPNVDYSSGYVLIPPTVQVTANGTDGPLTLHPGQSLQIGIGFDAHAVGTVSPAELYLGLAGPFGVVWFTPSGLSLSPVRLYAGPLPTFGPATLLDIPNVAVFPSGIYYWFMVVDADSNGVLNGDYLDVVQTTIAPAS